MLATAPDAALTSATNNWGVYYTYAIAQAMRGQKVATNWVGGFDIGAVAITQLGSACAAGTAEKVAEVEKAIHDGTLQVFDTSKFTISTKCTDGSYRTDDNGRFSSPARPIPTATSPTTPTTPSLTALIRSPTRSLRPVSCCASTASRS